MAGNAIKTGKSVKNVVTQKSQRFERSIERVLHQAIVQTLRLAPFLSKKD